MINSITKHSQSTDIEYDFSVLIPSWNNKDMLQFCLNSIKNNSQLKIQPIIIANEGTDGTVDWLKTETKYDFVHAVKNVGICYALNSCRPLIKSEYVVYLNDDMYVLPEWDTVLMNEIKKIEGKSFMLSATMIEPTTTGNKCVVVKDYGRDIDDFREQELLNDYKNLKRTDWSGSTWPPNVVHIDLWDLLGGLSTEFHPGMYSDPDFAMKAFNAGVRNFKGVGSSLVYHFGSKSTKRIKKNKGRRTFLLKWGITSNVLTNQVLKSGHAYKGPINDLQLTKSVKLLNKLKRMLNC